MGSVHLWKVSIHEKCPFMGGVHVSEMSAYGRCPLMGSVHVCELSELVECPPFRRYPLSSSFSISVYGNIGV